MENGVPFLEHSDGSHVQMPTMIFQYGLGAYDLWLIEKKKEHLNKAITCADWAVENQQDNGAWSNFFYIYPDAPYSAMPQGEGASLLLRVHKETADDKYLVAAKKALQYMLLDVNMGGVAKFDGDSLYLLEYTHLPLVLNGWIFAFFGLYDMSLVCGDFNNEMNQTLKTIKEALPKFDCGYWSLYDEAGKITSPFYHNLHIAQMQGLYLATGEQVFDQYCTKFKKYQDNKFFHARAFLKKAIQKIGE